jgi:hypothetical protein
MPRAAASSARSTIASCAIRIDAAIVKVVASRYRLLRVRRLLVAAILFALLSVAALVFVRTFGPFPLRTAPWVFDVLAGLTLVSLAAVVAAWVAFRRSARWRCPSCRQSFFVNARVRQRSYFYYLFQSTDCANCGARLNS